MSEEKNIELSDDDRKIRKYRIILGIFAFLSGWFLFLNMMYAKGTVLFQFICTTAILSIFVYIYIWFYQKFLSRKDILRFMMYTILMIIFITLLLIPKIVLEFYSGICGIYKVPQECQTIVEAELSPECLNLKKLCDNRKNIQNSIWGYYFIVAMFVLPVMTIFSTLKRVSVLNRELYKMKILIFIITTLIIVLIPLLYYLIFGDLLFLVKL